VATLKALGDAKIDKRKRTVTAEAKSSKADNEVHDGFKAPVEPDVLKLLGNPYERDEQSDAKILTYKYQLKGATTADKNKDKVYWVKLKFDKRTKMLLSTEGRLFFGTIKITNMLAEPSVKEDNHYVIFDGLPTVLANCRR
jgi:hypothetical protein